MLIKHQALAQHMQKKAYSLYLVIGQDTYLIEEALQQIRQALKKSSDCDEKKLNIQSTEDWKQVMDEANNYSLFADTVLLLIDYDKKTLDAAGKKLLTEYLDQAHARCIIVLRAPNLPARHVSWLTDKDSVLAVAVYGLTEEAMLQWINSQLKAHSLTVPPGAAAMIQQYTQGNMLATAQLIEKLSLLYDPGTVLEMEQVSDHVTQQSDHSLYELMDACLAGRADKAIQILRLAASDKTESTLVLWMFTQEIRLLSQLMNHLQQNLPFKTACTQLKIWPQRQALYQSCIKRLQPEFTKQLLHFCQVIDERIKSNLSNQTWNSLECLALALSLGKLVQTA